MSVVALTLGLVHAKQAEAHARTAQRAADSERVRVVSERQRADQQAAVARAVSDFLQNDLLKQSTSLEQANRGFAPKPELTVKEALRRASDKIGGRFADQPTVEAEIRDTLGVSFGALSEWEVAIPQLERAAVLFKQTAGTNAPETLEAMSHLARAYSQTGRLPEAVSLAEENLKFTRARFGPDDAHTLDRMENLATVYKEAGRFADELSLCEEVLRLTRAKFGSQDLATLGRMNNLALAYHFAGRSDEALVLQEEVTKLAKSILGPDHPNTLMAIQNLAMNYQEAGRWMEAIPLLQDLLRVQQAELGPEHQNTLRTMNSLAGAYHGAGLLGAAVPLQEQALALFRKNLGPDHPDTLINMNNLSGLYLEEGRTNEAIALSEEAFNLAKAKLGPEHPDTLSIMNGLALGYRDAGRVNEAISLHEQVLTASTTKLGMNHPRTVTTLENLLADYLIAGRRAEADSLLRQVLSPAVAGSPQSLAPLRVRANYLARTGQWREAAEDLKRLTNLKSSNSGDWHYLAIILIQTGDLDGYRDHCRKTLERFANASDALTTFRVAKDCLLQPDSRVDPELAVRMIDNALLAGTNSVQWPMFESTKALAEYRRGHFAKALEWAEAARSFHPDFPCHCWRPGLEAEADAILAVAHHQLQQRELARTTLAAAQDLVGNKLPNIGSNDLGPDWLDSIVSHTLLREATALIGSHPEEREAGK